MLSAVATVVFAAGCSSTTPPSPPAVKGEYFPVNRKVNKATVQRVDSATAQPAITNF